MYDLLVQTISSLRCKKTRTIRMLFVLVSYNFVYLCKFFLYFYIFLDIFAYFLHIFSTFELFVHFSSTVCYFFKLRVFVRAIFQTCCNSDQALPLT